MGDEEKHAADMQNTRQTCTWFARVVGRVEVDGDRFLCGSNNVASSLSALTAECGRCNKCRSTDNRLLPTPLAERHRRSLSDTRLPPAWKAVRTVLFFTRYLLGPHRQPPQPQPPPPPPSPTPPTLPLPPTHWMHFHLDICIKVNLSSSFVHK